MFKRICVVFFIVFFVFNCEKKEKADSENTTSETAESNLLSGPQTQEKVQQILAGLSRMDVKLKLGVPCAVNESVNGGEVWTYYHSRTMCIGADGSPQNPDWYIIKDPVSEKYYDVQVFFNNGIVAEVHYKFAFAD
jgi:hypothetical protein